MLTACFLGWCVPPCRITGGYRSKGLKLQIETLCSLLWVLKYKLLTQVIWSGCIKVIAHLLGPVV